MAERASVLGTFLTARWSRIQKKSPFPGGLRIGHRLGLGFALLTGLMLTLMLIGILNMSRVNQRMHQILRVSNAKVWHANAIRDAAHTAERVALITASHRAEAARSMEYVKLLTAWATLRHSLQELDLLESGPQGRELLDRLRRTMSVAKVAGSVALDGALRPGVDGQLADRMKALRTPLLELQDLCAELVAYEKEQTDLVDQQVRETYEFTRNSFLALGCTGVLVAALTAFRLTRSLTGPLREGVGIAHRLAEGDLAVDIRPGRADETGELLSAMREMADRLRQTRSLEAQLLQAQKLETVGRLAGGVAHDFNNILTVIIGQAQMGQIPVHAGADPAPRFASIEQAANRAAALTRQLLAFSRKQVMDVRVLDLGYLVRNLRKMLGRLIGEDVELVITLAQDLGGVRADPVQIEQILLNLAVNARDAMPTGGRLTIATQNVELDDAYTRQHLGLTPGPYVMLAVTDTGIGMSPEVRERIFEPFFTTKEEGKGTGLGLATVYGIVKQSQGDVWVYSEPGRGTTFKIFFPRVADQSDSTAEEIVPATLARGSEVILLVEDEPQVREMARTTLEGCGYAVLEAAHGREALELRRRTRGPIHLLLSDMVMPGMSGLQLARQIAAESPGTRILLMSGYIEHGLSAEELPGGEATHFLQKPFALVELARRVREVLDNGKGRLPSVGRDGASAS